MMKGLITLAAVFLTGLTPVASFAQIQVITSITPIKSLVEAIGGDRVSVSSIGRGTEDPHFVEVRPSFLMAIGQAKLYVSNGMSLDFWAKPLIENSRNTGIVIVDASTGVRPLGLPTERVSALLGDVHPEGNPHYWVDPYNIPVVVKNILGGLAKVDPANIGLYQSNAKAFLEKLKAADAGWQKRLAPYKNTKIVTFHESWDYFAEHFKLAIVGQVEPKPGIPPSGSHTQEIIELIKREKIPLILEEPYYPDSTPKLIAAETGTKVVRIPQLCEGAPGTATYLDLMEHDVGAVEQALKR